MNVGEKVITGEWDGQPIWRTRRTDEVLLDLIDKNEHEKLIQSTGELPTGSKSNS